MSTSSGKDPAQEVELCAANLQSRLKLELKPEFVECFLRELSLELSHL